MGENWSGLRVLDMKALACADAGPEASDFLPDSFVLILEGGESLTFTSATDWTLRVEQGTWPGLPAWAWPPGSWRYEDLDTPIGATGFEEIRNFTELRNKVSEVIGVEIAFDSGAMRLTAGESIAFKLRKYRIDETVANRNFGNDITAVTTQGPYGDELLL